MRAMQIANYIIKTALDNGKDITNLHLQKILYYLQALNLVEKQEPLFNENIEKWRLGPVVPEVYHEYKGNGSRPIEKIEMEIIFDEVTMDVEPVEFDENDLCLETRCFIQPSILKLLEHNPFELVDKTHEHELWNNYREEIESGKKGLRYTNVEMYNYFQKHRDKLKEVLEVS